MSWPAPWGRGPIEAGGVGIRTATDAGRDMLVNSPDGWEVDRPWLWWFGEGNGPDAAPADTLWGNPPPGALDWGPPFFVPPAVTRCTSLICDTLAGMPWQVRRGRERVETPSWIEDPQAKRRDGRIYGGPLPQWRRSPVEFRSSSIKSMLWQGESIWYVPVRDANGDPAPPIWQLNPAFVSIEGGAYVIPSSNPVALGLADWADEASDGYTFEDGELIVIRGMLGEGPRGISVFAAHGPDLALAQSINLFATNMLRRGVPLGYLKVNAPNLTREQAQTLQGDWMAAHGGLMRRIAVLNATTEFHALTLDAAAVELAKMRDLSTLDWALIFGVSPYLLGVTADARTYANVESRMIEFAEFTLLPWSKRVESTCNAELPRGTDMKINLDGLRRADTKTRYEAHRIALTEPAFLTVEEVRELEDRPPMPVEAEIEAAEAAAATRRLELLPGGENR
jgi:phage portal protein BeeE